jgi:predicted DNA-binding transcriptional regulator AlpA
MARAERVGLETVSRRPMPRRGLRKDEAAIYCGISASLFDAWVREGKMPDGARIGGVVLWDIRKLDMALDDLFGSGDEMDPFA